MLLFYINEVSRTADVTANTLRVQNQIQQRTDSCQFEIFSGSKPVENQDLKIYNGATIASQAGATIVLKATYQTDVGKFRAGQVIWLNIGDVAIEKATILTYTESTRTIVLTAAPVGALSDGDLLGELLFGGVVARVTDSNPHSLTDIEYQVTGVDYTKIFDKKLVSDTWEDVDSRYIVNDFVNRSVNYNSLIDDIDYVDNAAIQAEWIEASDGGNPTIDAADFLEGDSSGVFPWTFAGGTAVWAATPTARDVSEFTGVATGQPTRGEVMIWVKTSDFDDITSFKMRIGSSNANYAEVTFTLRDTTDWQYVHAKLATSSVTGVPDWENMDYAQARVVETANGTIRLNGLRINASGSFTLYNVQSTPEFDQLRSPQLKPMALINQIAKTWEYTWYIDYERDIHLIQKEAENAPFEITQDTDNFYNLTVDVDTSNMGNRVIVRGGEKTSDSRYAQVFEGDGVLREWLAKNKFNNLEVLIDDNTSTDLTEAGTNTTTINATAHGLSTGDHIVNRTRSNAVRQVTVVTANQFTVEAVPSQTNGDTFSKFATVVTIGIEGLADETLVDYVYNSNEKSIRATSATPTLIASEFIRFEYNERVPIQIQYTDSASANALRALGLGDGVFDLDPITDRNITDVSTAISLAQARVNEFSNAVVTVKFTTEQEGLQAGQILHVADSNRTFDENYVIQTVTIRQLEGTYRDRLIFSVTAGTTLFGWIEFMQKLLRTKDSIELNVDDIVETYATSEEEATTADVNDAQLGGFLVADEAEIVTTADVNAIYETTLPWQWEPSVGQPIATRWDLAEWS